MVMNARLLVDPPTSPGPLPYGLLTVAQPRPASDPHWQAGVTWVDVCGADDATYDPCITSAPAATGTPTAKSATTGRVGYGATPFTVFAELDCAPVDFYNGGEQLVTDALQKAEAWSVERAFWTGQVRGVDDVALPHLAADVAIVENGLYPIILQQSATSVTGVGVAPACALGLLEASLATCLRGNTGVIHVPPQLLPTLAERSLVVRDGGRLRTTAGNLVVVGAGYPGTGPDGTAAPSGTMWIYATGPVFYYRSGVRVLPPASGVDRSVNTVHLIAERTYVLGYDCCLLAALVCLDCDCDTTIRTVTLTGTPPASQVVSDQPVTYLGFTLKETTGTAPAKVVLWDNSSAASGTILEEINLLADESAREDYTIGVPALSGVYCQVVSGSVAGGVRIGS